MKRIFLIFSSIIIFTCLQGQELNCKVMINHAKVPGTNQQVFDALKTSIEDLMNNTSWTNIEFKQNERIECSINIIVNSLDNDMMKCELQVQSRRPVWGSSYVTPMLNIRDEKVNFTFRQYEALTITPTYDNNLVAVLAYYAYLIIGYDLDSFQKLSGTPVFNMAENIVNISQSRSEPESDGWMAIGKNSKRYELISNLLDDRFREFREYIYDYHRQGLDMMSSNVDNGRAKIANGLHILQDMNRIQPQSRAVVAFLDAKTDEFINIFSGHSTDEEKNKVYDILTAVNPTQTSRYEQIKINK